MRSGIKHQQGLALVSVLFITALVVTIITAISHRQTLDIQLTGNLIFRSQAFLYARGAEVYASEMLFRDFEKDGAGSVKDAPQDEWVQYGAALPMDDGIIEVELFDLQGRFNINSLIDDKGKVIPKKLEYFKRLIAEVSKTHSVNIPSELAESIADWVDEDDDSTGLGSEEGDYLVKTPSYRTLNYMASSVEELALIEGMQGAFFDLLEPNLAALPESATQININLAPKEVLLALSTGISESDIDTLIEDRAKKDGEFEDVNSFLAHPAFAGLTDPLDANDFTVSSNYFLMKGRVTLGDRVVQLYSVLWRDPKDGKTRVIARDLSKRFKPTKELIPL